MAARAKKRPRKTRKKGPVKRPVAKPLKPSGCKLKDVCEYLDQIAPGAYVTPYSDMPSDEDMPWMRGMYEAIYNLYKAVTRLEAIDQGYITSNDWLDDMLNPPGPEKAGAPPPPQFPPP